MSTLQATPELSINDLRDAVKREYSEVAIDPEKGFHFHTGTAAASRLEYDPAYYADLPEGSIASFAGTGNPFLAGLLSAGETVIDAGSGAGFDSLIAGTMVGPTGQVIGIDMTQEMLTKARAGAAAMGAKHVEFRDGLIEELPLADGIADVIISNGVLNLTLDKVATLSDWLRVLKPGGRIQIGDILVGRKIPDAALDDISLWTGWIAGGLLEADLVDSISTAGFEQVIIVQKHNIFQDVPDPSSALKYGTEGITFKATKPV